MKFGLSQESMATIHIHNNMFAQNPRDAAPLKIYERVLKEDPNHGMAIVQYANVAVERGRGKEAIPHVLQTLILCSKSKNIDKELLSDTQKLFAKIMAKPGMVESLMAQISQAAQSPPALGYLANVCKENGVLDA
eukprot:jgi/Bigna1/134076/aug1.23_g8784